MSRFNIAFLAVVLLPSIAGDFDAVVFNGASVLPTCGRFVMLGQEAGGPDKGTWDAFGGARDAGEITPLETASREFAEETAYVLFDAKQARSYIDYKNNATTKVIVNKRKYATIFFTELQYCHVKKLKNVFHQARLSAKSWKCKEKSELAKVSWDSLSNAIGSAHRLPNGKLPPVTVVGRRLSDNKKITMTIRPFLVSSLKPLCEKKSYIVGKNPKIHLYS